jgi:GT2 family glycosyltransferase
MITVSIVTYKTDPEELRQCLGSISSPLVRKVYVVDNSRSKETAEYCATEPIVEFIANDNTGYGAGHNIAICKAIVLGVKYHLVLNSDVHFGDDVLPKLVEYMNANEDVAQVQPNIIYPDGRPQYGCKLLPSPVNLLFRRFLPKCLTEKLNREFMLADFDRKYPMNLPYHQGSFMLFRVACFRTVGLFDERFFMYPEDIDITRRMHRHYRTMFYPYVTIIHAHRAASYKSMRMLAIHSYNMIKYFNKWGWIFDRERKEWNTRILDEIKRKNR